MAEWKPVRIGVRMLAAIVVLQLLNTLLLVGMFVRLGHGLTEGMLALEGAPPRPVLLVESGRALGRYFTLPDAPCEVRVGRGRDADCRVRDRSVSRSHILIRILEDGRVELRDLDALNGTWINGRRLRGDGPDLRR